MVGPFLPFVHGGSAQAGDPERWRGVRLGHGGLRSSSAVELQSDNSGAEGWKRRRLCQWWLRSVGLWPDPSRQAPGGLVVAACFDGTAAAALAAVACKWRFGRWFRARPDLTARSRWVAQVGAAARRGGCSGRGLRRCGEVRPPRCGGLPRGRRPHGSSVVPATAAVGFSFGVSSFAGGPF